MKAMRPVLACIMVAVAVYLSGCATLGSEKVSFKPDIKGRLSARGQPAAVTQMSKAELFDQDYVSLGHLTVEQIIKVCKGYSDSKTNEWISKGCKEKSPGADSTEVLLKRAAKRGADLVKLTKDGGTRTERTYAIICDSYMSVPTQEYVCPPVGGAGCYTRTAYRQQCVSTHQETTGHLVKRESSGTIWRLDPVLARNQEFMYAATAGDTARIRKVLDGGYDIFTKDPAGETALHRAASGGHVDVINILISRGLAIDVRAMDGATPLMAAAGAGKAGAVKALLAGGANVNAQQAGGGETGKYTPLMYAIRFGNPASVKAILKAKPDASLKNSRKLDAVGVAVKHKGALKFTEKYALVVTYTSGAHGFINKTGKIVISPIFVRANDFSDGLAQVSVGSGWGYIDKKGVMVIEPTFVAEDYYNYPHDFSEGLAAVKVDGKWGYIDKKGKMIIPPQFIPGGKWSGTVGPFKGGIARVSQKSRFNNGYIDRNGKFIVTPQYWSAGNFSEGLAAVTKPRKGFGYIDRSGKVVIDLQFTQGEDFSEGLAAVQVNKKWGFIDKTGTFIIQPRFEGKDIFWSSPGKFTEGRAAVRFGKKWGFIDKKGKIVVKPIYSAVEPFSEGRAVVLRNGLVGYIDKKGNEVIKPQFLNGTDFSEGLASVRRDKKFGFIDKTGKYVIKPIFEGASKFSEGLASVRVTGETLSYLLK